MSNVKANGILPLSNIYPHGRNYRKHSELQLQQLVESLRRFGQGRSVVAQKQADGRYMLVAGHGVVEAARRLRWTELRADLLPEDWDADAVNGYLLADNLTRNHGFADAEQLDLLLAEQQQAGYDLKSLGSSEKELQLLLAAVEDDRDLGLFEDDDDTALLGTPLIRAVSETPDQVIKYSQPVQLDEVNLTRKAVTPQEKLLSYEAGTIRQIVILFTPEEYAYVVGRIHQVQDTVSGLSTNTDVWVHVLRSFVADHQLPAIDLADPFEGGV